MLDTANVNNNNAEVLFYYALMRRWCDGTTLVFANVFAFSALQLLPTSFLNRLTKMPLNREKHFPLNAHGLDAFSLITL